MINNKLSLANKIYQQIDKLIYSGAIMGAMLIIAVTGVVFYEIFVRFFFNAPTTWTLDISIYFLIGSCFFSAAYLVRNDDHIRVDLVLQIVPPFVNRILSFLGIILVLLFSFLFTWLGVNNVIKSYELKLTSVSALPIPMYIPQMLLPIGGTLLCLAFLLQLIDFFTKKEEK